MPYKQGVTGSNPVGPTKVAGHGGLFLFPVVCLCWDCLVLGFMDAPFWKGSGHPDVHWEGSWFVLRVGYTLFYSLVFFPIF